MPETAVRHLRLLSDVVAAVTGTLDLDEVLARVAESVAAALGADACFVYVLDERSRELVLGASVGSQPAPSSDPPRMRVGDGVTGWAAQHRTTVAIERDAHLDSRFKRFPNLDEDAYASILAVPIVVRERLVGALNARTRDPRSYGDDEVELLTTIAAQVGHAIENARLYHRSQRRVAELEALHRVSRTITAPVELDEALADVVRAAADAAHADVCVLALASAPGEPPAVAFRSRDDGPDDATLAAAAARAPLEADGLIAVPVETRRQRLGALVCTRDAGGPFSREERALLGSIAVQAGGAVAAARGTMRGLLAQEIHHRVKNNLQTVASLLRLAAAADTDPRRALRDSVGRVLSIAEVHDVLTRGQGDEADGADLVKRLTAMLGQSVTGRNVTSSLAPIVLPARRATALALVYCELFANAAEHGAGELRVVLRRDGAFGELSVEDDGRGVPVVVRPGQGLAIARALAESDLDGSLRFPDRDSGVQAVVRFPLEVQAR